MSVDVYLIHRPTGKNLIELNWIRNPFGLARWLQANVPDAPDLPEMIREHVQEGKHTRGDLAHAATKVWRDVSALTEGHFVMPLDWSWMWPSSVTPCLWSMCDNCPWLWDHTEVIEVKARPATDTFKWYKQSPNITTVKVEQAAFLDALPESHAQFFRKASLEDYQEWARGLVGICLGYTDPSTALDYSA